MLTRVSMSLHSIKQRQRCAYSLAMLLLGLALLAIIRSMPSSTRPRGIVAQDAAFQGAQLSNVLPAHIDMGNSTVVWRRNPRVPVQRGYKRLVCLSDTHGLHETQRPLQVPAGDVLVFAGDAGMEKFWDAAAFNTFLRLLPHAYKVVTFGNMDTWGQSESFDKSVLDGASTVLMGNGKRIAGLVFAGSPYTPAFTGVFQLADERAAERHWARALPSDAQIDVLVTHGPPRGYGDATRGKNAGDAALLRAVQRLQQPPKLWVVGHIHASYGIYKVRHEATGEDIILANVAVNALRDGKNTAPLIFDVPV